MGLATRIEILDEAVCILLRDNALGKGMNPFFLPPTRGKELSLLVFQDLVRQPGQEKENFQFNKVLLRLKIGVG